MIQTKQWITKAILISALFASTFATAVFAAPEKADTCADACSMFVKCTGEIIGRTPSASESNTLTQGCMKTCEDKKHGKGVMACYEKAKKSENSCVSYHQCVQANAAKQK